MTLFHIQKKFSEALRSSKENKFSIYQNSMIANLQKTLQTIFPVCEQLVGVLFFLKMTQEFILKNPSNSYDLALYGTNFPAFTADYAPAKSLSYLSDITTLEWALYRSAFAKPSKSFDFSLISVGKEIYFSLPDESFLMRSAYPIHNIWQMHQIDISNQTITLEENKNFYFFILQNRIEVLQKVEWEILQSVKNHMSLTEIVSFIEESDAKEKIPSFIQKGWLENYL